MPVHGLLNARTRRQSQCLQTQRAVESQPQQLSTARRTAVAANTLFGIAGVAPYRVQPRSRQPLSQPPALREHSPSATASIESLEPEEDSVDEDDMMSVHPSQEEGEEEEENVPDSQPLPPPSWSTQAGVPACANASNYTCMYPCLSHTSSDKIRSN
jgi:hypothetical protein